MTVRMYRYQIPPKRYEGHGTAIMDSTGFFAAVTDYGNYAYHWHSWRPRPAPGVEDVQADFRDWFAHADTDYIRRKCAPELIFDLEATVKVFKKDIAENRRNLVGRFTADNCRRWWSELEQLGDEFDWVEWMRSTDMPDAWDHGSQRSAPCNAKAFEERFLPRLQAAAREDFEREQKLAADLASSWMMGL